MCKVLPETFHCEKLIFHDFSITIFQISKSFFERCESNEIKNCFVTEFDTKRMEITWRNCRSRLLSTATMIHRRIIRVDACASQIHAAFLSTIQFQHRGNMNYDCEKIARVSKKESSPSNFDFSTSLPTHNLRHKSTHNNLEHQRTRSSRVFFETWENRVWFTRTVWFRKSRDPFH